jgi:predicted nucleotidyltransferase
MRLTEAQRAEIVALTKRRFGRLAVVRLFGSRTRDDECGGDIDLHIQAESADLATLANELEFTVELKARIGDEKIDVIVRRPGHSPCGIDDVALRTGLIL